MKLPQILSKLFEVDNQKASSGSIVNYGNSYDHSPVLNVTLNCFNQPTDIASLNDLAVSLEQSIEVRTFLDKKIEEAVSAYDDLNPIHTIELLKDCESFKSGAKSIQSYTVAKYFAAANFILENIEDASKYFLEAYNLRTPEVDEEASILKMKGLILAENLTEAWIFGKNVLEKYPVNKEIAAYLVIASDGDSNKKPYDYIDELLHESPEVLIAEIRLHQRKGFDFLALAKDGYNKFPENQLLKNLYAEASYQAIFRGLYHNQRFFLTAEEEDEVIIILPIIEEMWSKRSKNAILTMEATNTCISLVEIYSIQKNIEKLSHLAKELYNIESLHIDLIGCIITHLLIHSKFELVENFPCDLQELPELYVSFLINSESPKIFDLSDEFIQQLPIKARNAVQIVSYFRKIKKDLAKPNIENINSFFDSIDNDVQAYIMLASYCSEYQRESEAEMALKRAIASVTQETPLPERERLADYACYNRSFRSVIELLGGIPNLSEESLYYLSYAYGSIFPVSKKAITFFETLPEDLIEQLRFKLNYICLYMNSGDMPAAEKHLKELIALYPNDTRVLSIYLECLARQYKHEEYADTVDKVDFGKVQFINPDTDSHFATLASHCAHSKKFLEFCYKLLYKYPQSDVIFHRITGVGLFTSSEKTLCDVIEYDTYFKVKNQSGEFEEALVVNSEEVVVGKELTKKQALIDASLGKKVGDTILLTRQNGMQQEWEVAEIIHKFFHAIRELVDSSESRYGSKSPYMKFTVDTSSPKALLESLESNIGMNPTKVIAGEKQFAKNIAQAYKEIVPLCCLEKFAKTNISNLIRSLSEQDIYIEICTQKSVSSQLSYLRDYKSKDIVLDSYTLFFASVTGMLPYLHSYFDKLIISQRSYNYVAKMLLQPDISMNINEIVDNFSTNLLPEKLRTSYEQVFKKAFEDINQYILIKPVVQQKEFSEEEKKVFNLIGIEAYEYEWLSIENNALLLCEDNKYANTKPHLPRISLEIFVVYFLSENIIKTKAYQSFVDYLIHNNHQPMLYHFNHLLLVDEDTAQQKKYADWFITPRKKEYYILLRLAHEEVFQYFKKIEKTSDKEKHLKALKRFLDIICDKEATMTLWIATYILWQSGEVENINKFIHEWYIEAGGSISSLRLNQKKACILLARQTPYSIRNHLEI